MLQSFHILLLRLLSGANLLTVLLLWTAAGSVYLNPQQWPTLALAGLAFPIFAVINACFIPVWLLLSRIRLWIPLAGFACCFGTLYTYCPVNIPSPHPKGSIKVVSYNTMGFGHYLADEQDRNVIANYLKESNADIICVQEGGGSDRTFRNKILNLLPHLPYHHRMPVGHEGNMMACISRYPILKAEQINYKSNANGSVAYLLKLADKDTLVVVNNHLESNHLSQSDRDRYKSLIKRPEETPVKKSSTLLARKIRNAGRSRGSQVDSVAAYVDRQLAMGRSVILCGDFNDTPISYARHRLSQRLTDTYTATANGPGFSFNRDGILVRIDHLMCSGDWQPYSCRVDRSIRASDHFPISCYLKRKPRS